MSANNCPACLSTNINLDPSYQLKQNGGKYLPNTYRMLVCSNCGLWFKDNIPLEQALKAHYASLTTEAACWNYTKRLPHEKQIDKILSYLPASSKVLDVGCWTGRLLSEHRDRLKIYGIEPNDSAAAVASNNGLTVLGSEVFQELAETISFDCITMVDVFEHLPNPLPTLRHLIAALVPGGQLLIVTGQTDCFPVWLLGGSYWYFACPDHLIFANRRFSQWLGKTIPGIQVKYSSIRHFKFQWHQYLYELAWLFSWRFISPHSPIPKLAIHKLPGFKRFERLKEPLVCGMWLDHCLIQITKLG